MTDEKKKEKLEKLNKKCVECRKRYGNPTYDHCNYHCTIGAQIHRLDAESENGWGSHDHWSK